MRKSSKKMIVEELGLEMWSDTVVRECDRR